MCIRDRLCEQAGAAAIAVHGRTRVQMYAGRADWDVIRDVKRAVGIPVIANGDVFSGADAAHILSYTGADACMVGRGAFGDPWLFAETVSYTHLDVYKRQASSRSRVVGLFMGSVAWIYRFSSALVAIKSTSLFITGKHKKHACPYSTSSSMTTDQVWSMLDPSNRSAGEWHKEV